MTMKIMTTSQVQMNIAPNAKLIKWNKPWIASNKKVESWPKKLIVSLQIKISKLSSEIDLRNENLAQSQQIYLQTQCLWVLQ